MKPRVVNEFGTSAAGATESSARWPTTLVACTLAVDERTRAAPVKPVKSRLLTRYNAAAVVLQATHAEEAYGPRLQFVSRVVGCSADVRLRAKESHFTGWRSSLMLPSICVPHTPWLTGRTTHTPWPSTQFRLRPARDLGLSGGSSGRVPAVSICNVARVSSTRVTGWWLS